MTTGTGVFFDGQTSRRQDVHVSLEATLVILRPDGTRIDAWPYSEIRELPSPPDILRLNRLGGPKLARLEIRDGGLAAAARAASPRLDASRVEETGTTRKVVLWSLAAVVSVTLFATFGLPALADRITPLLPWSVDQRMGRAADQQLRLVFPTEPGGFACGEGSEEKPGRQALDRLAKKLSDAAALPIAVEIVAVRSDFVNALALPGGPIYLFDGLIERAKTGDEIAGVLAHEIGHVAHRDGTKRAIQAGGASLLFGFILGDFVGGTATIAIVQAVSEASYSRVAETSADAYSVAIMRKLGGDPRAVGEMLTRLTDEAVDEPAKDGGKNGKTPANGKADPKAGESSEKPDEKQATAETPRPTEREEDGGGLMGWIASHPATADRRKAIDAIAGHDPVTPLVDDADFLAIKRICGKKP